ncbi:S8 family serine peptidase [Algoriphagus namhaensis]
MKKIIVSLLAFFLVGGVVAQSAKRYVVKLKEKELIETTDVEEPNSEDEREREFRSRQTMRGDKLLKARTKAQGKVRQVLETYADVEVGFVAEMTEAQASEFRSDPEVESVIEDFKMQGRRPQMQGRRPQMQSRPKMQEDYGYDIELGTSCAISAVGGPVDVDDRNDIIWIIDSGIEARHKNLKVNRKFSKSFIGGDPLVDPVGHGTHMAGIAAGNGAGGADEFRMTGVAQNARLVSLQVLDENGEGYWSDILLALDHVAQYGKKNDVVLMSLGIEIDDCESANPQLKEAIFNLAEKGIFVVMSAGNDGERAQNNLPGCIQGDQGTRARRNIFTIGSVDTSCDQGIRRYSNFSNFGRPVKWVAPGRQIFSTFPDNSFHVGSGTSMSAALFAGVVYVTKGRPEVLEAIMRNNRDREYDVPTVRE